MTAHIKHVKPDLVVLHELRAGDNFEHTEHEGWVFKKISGVKQFIPECDDNASEKYTYAVTECSGEVFQFKENCKVYPLIEPTISYAYDFDREFEGKREV
ncbi:hypothetical protein NVP1101O_010 [Vibrio phage 1.101.O._10N.261.45.C6]|nr:hypothetical protein NVP1101O_010 [Vibrio phage 1.101.O._10N.261.45.C6]